LVLPDRRDGSPVLPEDREGPADRFLSPGEQEDSVRRIVSDYDYLYLATIAGDGSLAWQRIWPIRDPWPVPVVSPDGKWFSAIWWSPDRGPDHVYLLPARPGATLPDPLQLGMELRGLSRPSFSPSSGRLLLWKRGLSPDPGKERSDYPPALGVVDVASRRAAFLDVPSWLGTIWDADWLSEDEILVSGHGYGLVRMNVSTGEIKDVLRIPGPGIGNL
jgi:hypothetical protein